MEYQKFVREFQLASSQPVASENAGRIELTKSEAEFRTGLLREEVRELWSGIVNLRMAHTENDVASAKVEILDAIADCTYVNLGTANQIGAVVCNFLDKNFYQEIGNNLEYTTLSDLIGELSDIVVNESIHDVIAIQQLITMIARKVDLPLENFNEALRRVHHSNMTKCVGGRIIKDKKTGKVLKPDTFEPVDLTNLVW